MLLIDGDIVLHLRPKNKVILWRLLNLQVKIKRKAFQVGIDSVYVTEKERPSGSFQVGIVPILTLPLVR